MALNLESKKAIVAEVSTIAASALSAVAAEYRGITVGDMTELRAKARDEGVYLKVAKNSLVKRAVEGTEFECMQDELKGPLIMVKFYLSSNWMHCLSCQHVIRRSHC